MANKPHWMSQAAWYELLAKYGGIPKCEVTGEVDDLSVDHIVPRYRGGTDDIDNLQFLSNQLNVEKGVKPDPYWNRQFFFDEQPDLSNCRYTQRRVYENIVANADWFGQNFTQTSRVLHVVAAATGGGKTQALLVGPSAISSVISARRGAARRPDRTLILAKEEAIRDQIADDLANDPEKFGIYSRNPRVLKIERGDQLDDETNFLNYDVFVACIHQLWDITKDDTRLQGILHKFPVIQFDEPHFAADRVKRIVELATTSICIGYTGTPIDAAGRLLEDMYLLTLASYQEISENDRCLKWVDDDRENFGYFFKEVGIDEARILANGSEKIVKSTDEDESYPLNIEPGKSVVRAVIEEMKARDAIRLNEPQRAAKHRPSDAIVDVLYPCHPQIVCDSIATAEILCKNTQDLFEANRAEYPVEQGWNAEVAHSGSADENKKIKYRAKPLTKDHPWLRYKKIGKIDRQCARICFFVQTGREGVHNATCGPIGVVGEKNSKIEGPQRKIGRQIRSVHSIDGDGKLHVAPQRLDTVLVISHAAFGSADLVREALNFVCNMEDYIKLPTVEQLKDATTKITRPPPPPYVIPTKTKLDIVAALAATSWDEEVVMDRFGGERPEGSPETPKRTAVREWINTLSEDKAEARGRLGFVNVITQVNTVITETVRHDPKDEELERFILLFHRDLISVAIPVTDFSRIFVRKLWIERHDRYQLPPLTSPYNDIDEVRKFIGGLVYARLGGHLLRDRSVDGKIWAYVGSAVKMKLGVPKKDVARIKGKYDSPQTHAIVLRPDSMNEIIGYVCGRLIDEGHCPRLFFLKQ